MGTTMRNQLPVHCGAAEDSLNYFIPHPCLSELPGSLEQAWLLTLHRPVGWLGDSVAALGSVSPQ